MSLGSASDTTDVAPVTTSIGGLAGCGPVSSTVTESRDSTVHVTPNPSTRSPIAVCLTRPIPCQFREPLGR